MSNIAMYYKIDLKIAIAFIIKNKNYISRSFYYTIFCDQKLRKKIFKQYSTMFNVHNVKYMRERNKFCF